MQKCNNTSKNYFEIKLKRLCGKKIIHSVDVCSLVMFIVSSYGCTLQLRSTLLSNLNYNSFSGKFFSRSCMFSMLWVLTNFLYIRGLYALGCSEMISLFATNVSFVYMLSWVVLHEQFVGIRVSNTYRRKRKVNFRYSIWFRN